MSDDLINRLIEAATKAPSGGNREPWAFIVVRDPETKGKIGDYYLDAWSKTYVAIPEADRGNLNARLQRAYGSVEHLAQHLAEAPVLIMVCAKNRPPDGGYAGGHYGSIFPAVQNLLLAACGLELGAALTMLHKMHDAEINELLGLPDNVETVALIPIGYPKGRYGPPTRRPVAEVTHQERWDNAKT